MVVGNVASDCPLVVGDDLIEWVEQFSYLESLISDDRRVSAEVEKRIASTSKAFGALQCAIFKNCQ